MGRTPFLHHVFARSARMNTPTRLNCYSRRCLATSNIKTPAAIAAPCETLIEVFPDIMPPFMINLSLSFPFIPAPQLTPPPLLLLLSYNKSSVVLLPSTFPVHDKLYASFVYFITKSLSRITSYDTIDISVKNRWES